MSYLERALDKLATSLMPVALTDAQLKEAQTQHQPVNDKAAVDRQNQKNRKLGRHWTAGFNPRFQNKTLAGFKRTLYQFLPVDPAIPIVESDVMEGVAALPESFDARTEW
jgi:hypothetical protein